MLYPTLGYEVTMVMGKTRKGIPMLSSLRCRRTFAPVCLAVLCMLFSSVGSISAQCIWIEETSLLASDGAALDYFGYPVSVDGDVAIVGAFGDDDNGTDSGSAYVYRFNGTDWIEEAKLLASDGQDGDRFGFSAVIDGDAAIIGAYRDDDKGMDSGSAYVYLYNGTNWVEETKLLASDGANDDWFGVSVCIDGDTAIVGACRDDDNGIHSGSAYVYHYNGMNWVETKLLASDGSSFDWFGYATTGDNDAASVIPDDPTVLSRI